MAMGYRSTPSIGQLHENSCWAADQRLIMGTGVFATPNATLDRLPIGPTPVCIAFKTWSGYSHMNVIWPNPDGGIFAMEPFFRTVAATASAPGVS